ncbi:MAG TPA: cytochrome c oxidase subunit 3 family protein [Steroidobacteraceae bacterium]|jgi:cytochrome c oxidase subunit 3|nr:cytochrome c oxidase subunit 3 family protein [Steroidobacteraceae bacterium]
MSASAADIGPEVRDPFVEEQFDDAVQQREAATFGMWVFLSTEILFFGVLFASYTICRVLHPQGFAIASRRTDMLFGSIETAVLLVSSSLIALALRAIKLGRRRLTVGLMVGTAALGICFLTMHGFEYHKEYTEHLIPGIDFMQTGRFAYEVELFFCLYYFITGFHSLHVLIGVSVILVLALRVARGAFGPQRHTTLELTALYWHLVDIVWIFVYPLIYLVGRAG